MRILSITAQKPDSTGSGVYLTELVKGFEKMGISQAVIAGVTKEDVIRLPKSVKVYPVYYGTSELPYPVLGMSDEMPYRSTRYSDMNDEMTSYFEKAFGAQIRKVCEEFQPDLILCHHLYYLTSIVRDLCRDQKVFAICHGSDMRQVKKNPWKREVIKERIPKLDGIFSLHEDQMQEIQEYYGCKDDLIQVIGTGYNSEIFYMDRAEKKEDEIRLIFAGKISEKKGIKSLIRSLEYLDDKGRYTLALAGGSGAKEEYEEICRLAKAAPCKVEFLGRLDQRILAEEINRSDIFVLPSFYEGLPLVLIEAMACGAKAVCTDLPGIQKWIKANLKEDCVCFVRPPKMKNEDEPFEDELEGFERRLARAIQDANELHLPDPEVLKELSWESLCRRILEKI